MHLALWVWELKRQAEAGRRAKRSLIPGRRVPGKERRRQPRGDLQERWAAGPGEPSLMPAASRIPSARSRLRPGCGRHAFFGGEHWLKSLIGALWNRNAKGN